MDKRRRGEQKMRTTGEEEKRRRGEENRRRGGRLKEKNKEKKEENTFNFNTGSLSILRDSSLKKLPHPFLLHCITVQCCYLLPKMPGGSGALTKMVLMNMVN